MERLTTCVDQIKRNPNIPAFLSFVISPETGKQSAVDIYHRAIMSNDPTIVQAAIEVITDTTIPLHIAAQGLTEFMEKKEFHQQSPYELTAFHSARHDDPADSHINFGMFFDTTKPFEESLNYLALTKKGLTKIANKTQQPQYATTRSYQQQSIEACFEVSLELITNSIERIDDPIPDDFLQQCSFGPLYANFIDLFGTDGKKVYEKSERGINLLYEHGSWRDQYAVEQVRNKLGLI